MNRTRCAESTESTRRLPVSSVFPNPDQPRKRFDQEPLEELARSIRSSGLMQPITVTPRGDGYMIVAGERRWRATRIAELDSIEAHVRELDDAQVMELALIENACRQDITPLEEAFAFQAMVEAGFTVDQIAESLGIAGSFKICWRLDLLKLDAKYLEALRLEAISVSQAWYLSQLEDPAARRKLWSAIKSGQCETKQALCAKVHAIKLWAAQSDMFPSSSCRKTRSQDAALSKVKRFVRDSGSLIGSITDDDLSVIESIQQDGDVGLIIDRLELLIKTNQTIRKALVKVRARSELSTSIAG